MLSFVWSVKYLPWWHPMAHTVRQVNAVAGADVARSSGCTAGAPGEVDRELVEERADGLASALCAACSAIERSIDWPDREDCTQTTAAD